jgi:nicotinate-nucleotide adenylyltransferase
MAPMTLGILGGTFNPPHTGHLIVAEAVRSELALDKILFIPVAIPPHKMNHDIAAPHHRVEMLRRAVEGNPYFEVSEMEVRRGGISFTVDTLRQLQRERPDARLFLLIGMDNLPEFPTWRSPERILELATVVVMTRPGFAANDVPPDLKGRVRMCPVPTIGIASSDIRARVKEGKSIRYLVADSVRDYIHHHNLYRGG